MREGGVLCEVIQLASVCTCGFSLLLVGVMMRVRSVGVASEACEVWSMLSYVNTLRVC